VINHFIEPDRYDTPTNAQLEFGLGTQQGSLSPGAELALQRNPDYNQTKAYLMQVFVKEGLSIASVPLSELDTMTAQLLNDQDYQKVLASASTISTTTIASSATVIGWLDQQFFDPSLSSNEQWLTQGLQMLQAAGHALAPSQISALAQRGGTAGVMPFNLNQYSQELGFGAWDPPLGANTQWVEYAIPKGTPIVAPFGGTITTVDTGKSGWGRRLFIHLSNGDVMSFGHLSQFAVSGGSVMPGQVIGYSGGNPDDPSSGLSTGPHIDVIMQDPSGRYIDPTSTLTALKTGHAVPGLSATSSPSNITQIISQIATSLGIDPAIALATAYVESKWNPNAIGDNGHSVGLFQLHDQGEGAGMSVSQRSDPILNAQIALTQFARVRQQNPGIVNNPGLWAALAQRPADRADYANAVNGYFGQIKSGQMPAADYTAPGGAGFLDALKQKYPTAFSAYNSFFGQDPTAVQVQSLIAGGTDPKQITDAVRGLPSHLSGLNQGQYTDLRATVDSTSQSLLGHDGTDGIVAELHAAGTTTPSAIKDWYQNHSPNAIDHNTYHAIYQANQASMAAIYNTPTGFDPRIATQQYQQAVQASGGQLAGPAPATQPTARQVKNLG
jgi:soluble lytic murein transglycosylase-like protein